MSVTRPYSLLELCDLEREIYDRHRLSDVEVVHSPCLHRYRVKKGGRKEQHLLAMTDPSENNIVLNDQTCSVCFKMRTVGLPPSLECLSQPDGVLTKQRLDEIDTFYKWLYRHDF